MKKGHCSACYKEIEVFDEYEPIICCNGHGCGCMGQPINPVFCDECEEDIFGKPNPEDIVKE